MGVGREVSISLDGVRDKNIMQLKKLNIALFPVRYNDKYYSDALASAEFTKLGSFVPNLLSIFIREVIKKDLEINDLDRNMFFDRTLWRKLIHVVG